MVRCLPLTSVLEAFGAFHTNFFVLDVEVVCAVCSILCGVDTGWRHGARERGEGSACSKHVPSGGC